MIDVLICGIGGKMGENLVGVLKDDGGARVVCGVDAVSAVGCVDAVGRVWEWLNDLITRAEHATNADYHPTAAWGWDKKTPLKTGEKNYDVGNIYQYYAYSLAALIAGGYWYGGANAGARAVGCASYPWDVGGAVGGRGACDSM